MADRRANSGRRLVDVAGDFLKVKDWREFQHYHDRNPAWIKLHKKILDNAEFQMLPVASRALAPMLWLLASENQEGLIPWKPQDIAWRLRMKTPEFLEALEYLLSHGFFVICDSAGQSASTTLALMEHPASLEKETEREKETEKEKHATSAFVLPDWIPKSNWFEFVKMRNKIRKPPTAHAMELVVKELERLRASGQDPGDVLDQSTRNCWQDVFPLRSNGNGKQDFRSEVSRVVRAVCGAGDGSDQGGMA